MSTAFRPYTQEWEPAVGRFNRRISSHGGPSAFRFPESHVPAWLPPGGGRRTYTEMFLAADGDEVRGGYVLRTQDFWVDGQVLPVGSLQLPLSEGIVDPQFRFVGVQIVADALKRQPLLYALGMGGEGEAYPRLLKGMGWPLFPVPFLFRVVRPSRFLRGMPLLRRDRKRRLAADLLARTGAGWAGVRLAQLWASRGAPRGGDCRAEPVGALGDWADEVWDACKGRYTLAGTRDHDSLRSVFDGRYFKEPLALKVTRGGRPVGWAALYDTQMSGSRHFGDLRVGSLVDGFAAPEDAPAVVAAATDFLARRGVDLIVTNQTHPAWNAAARGSGYLEGPSNFAFAMSKPLAARLSPWQEARRGFHFDRADGDGPINL